MSDDGVAVRFGTGDHEAARGAHRHDDSYRRLDRGVPWAVVEDVPASMPPDRHGHGFADIGLDAGTHWPGTVAWSHVDGLDGGTPWPGTAAWASVSGRPARYPPETHGHALRDLGDVDAGTAWPGTAAWNRLTGVPAGWPGTMPWSQVTDKPTAFPPESHPHPTSGTYGVVDTTSSQDVFGLKRFGLAPEFGTPLRLESGGTGATDAAGARRSLELGSLATLDAVRDELWSGNPLSVTHGGTGATDVAGVRSALGLGSLATSDTVDDARWNGTPLSPAHGGTGATDAAEARALLGLGTLATLGTVDDAKWSGASLSVAHGGTGATDAAGARLHLGLGSLATRAAVDDGFWAGSPLALAHGGTGATDAVEARSRLGLRTLATLDVVDDSAWAGMPLSVGHGGTGASDAAGARAALGLGRLATLDVVDAHSHVLSDLADVGFATSWPGTLPWGRVTGKPAGYPPEPHTQLLSTISDVNPAKEWPGTSPWARVTGKPPTFPAEAHSHPWPEVTGVVESTMWPGTTSWQRVTGIPDRFPPSGHGHDWTDVSGVGSGTVWPGTVPSTRVAGIDLAALAADVAALKAERTGWTQYTPAVTGGYGAEATVGYYMRCGKILFLNIFVRRVTSPGSGGLYTWSLPPGFTADTSAARVSTVFDAVYSWADLQTPLGIAIVQDSGNIWYGRDNPSIVFLASSTSLGVVRLAYDFPDRTDGLGSTENINYGLHAVSIHMNAVVPIN